MNARRLSIGVALCAAVGAPGIASAATGPFTKDQMTKGEVTFNNFCAECHRPDLSGALGPSLKDDKFKKMFAGQPITVLRDFIYTNMPKTAPKSLSDPNLNLIVAWILSKNGVQPGDTPMSKDAAKATFPK